MDLDLLQQRSLVFQNIRKFFIDRLYLELDTPALSPTLIPETCLEVFETNYIDPWSNKKSPVYLVPSPEIYMKKIIAQHKISVFQLSKCYRNVESVGNTHSPEFTMLEYYTVGASYIESMKLTEDLFTALLPPQDEDKVKSATPEEFNNFDPWENLRPPFTKLTMDEAFEKLAGFRLSSCTRPKQLAKEARRLGIEEIDSNPFDDWPWDDLYELIFVHTVEPNLPKEKPVFLMNYPAKVPCLAQDCAENGNDSKPLWKERWELYGCGIELANCYSEETDSKKVKDYFEVEGSIKTETALIPHSIDNDYWKTFQDFPKCSGVAMGIDRLIMLLLGKKSIESVLPFPFRLKAGYY